MPLTESGESAFAVVNEDENKRGRSRKGVNYQPKYKNYHKNCLGSGATPTKVGYKRSVEEELRAEDFLDKLDAKLRDLKDEKGGRKGRKTDRPLFITTVKTGVFLEPPPELAALLGLRSLAPSSGSSGSLKSGDDLLMYSFSSQPRVLNNRLHKKNNNLNNKTHNKNENVLPKVNSRPKRDLNANHNNNNINNKKKEEGLQPCAYGNIMFDRRVVRGPATVQHPVPTIGTESQAARLAESRRRAMARRKAQTQKTKVIKLRLGTPPPVPGRKHEDVQTEHYLEELFDHPLETTTGTQTEFQLDRPPSPVFVPCKTGIDECTQIHPGELFEYNTEVQPIVEVLVGKTLEQAMVEVMEEEELEAIRRQQREFKELRDSELAEVQRLEEMERRQRLEMERRVLQQEEAEVLQKQTEDRVAAAVMTKCYIADLLPSIVNGLKEAGFVKDDGKEDVDDNFMSWLMTEVNTEMQRMVTNRDVLSELVREILENRAEIYRALGESEKQKIGIESEEESVVGSPLPSLPIPEGENREEEEEGA